MTLIGLIVAAVLMICGKKPRRWGGCIFFSVGRNWGGVELGLVFLIDDMELVSTKNHEFGHSIQNCYWGFLFPFVIAIPSAVRYWYRRIRDAVGIGNKTDYESIWFEGQATEWGKKNIKYWRLGK